MLGCYDITVSNKEISFELHIERNITIIRGMSGSGKSVFASMVDEYTLNGNTSGITIDANIDVKRLSEKVQLYNGYAKGRTIFVIDETDIILRNDGELKSIIENEDCYFIIITRRSLASLPYSIRSIYTFKREDNTLSRDFCVNKLCNMYAESYSSLVPDTLYTEDEKAGFQFYSKVLSVDCQSANGKSRVSKKLRSLLKQGKTVAAIVDGAAFGSDIDSAIEVVSSFDNAYILVPESFEWLVLMGLDSEDIKLIETYNHCDSTEFLSWERYYTNYLTEKSRLLGLEEYTKTKCPEWVFEYTDRILNGVPELKVLTKK